MGVSSGTVVERPANVRFGSISAETPCPRQVRFAPDSDQIADMKLRRRRATSRHPALRYTLPLFDHLIGNLLEVRWHVETQRLGCFEVDHKLKSRRLLDRQISWIGPFKYAIHVKRCTTKQIV
jgi:hypothetical protein